MKSLSVKLAVILIGLFIFGGREVLGEEKFLCVEEHSVGFVYRENSKDWVGTNFKTDSKYIISKSDDRFKVTRLGEDHPIYQCEKRFNQFGFLFCKGMVGEFKFNKLNGRFLATQPNGYINVIPKSMRSFEDKNKLIPFTDKDGNTPFMEIGKCSPF